MEKKLQYNKRGLSGIITAILMIALVMAAIVVVWTVVNNLVKGELENAESCVGSYGKVSINSLYTCYDTDAGTLQFSMIVRDVEVDAILISISSEGSTKSYTITDQAGPITDLTNYGSGTADIEIPDKNAGKTYVVDTGIFSDIPDLIEIAPIINGKQCDVSDSLPQVDDCLSLA